MRMKEELHSRMWNAYQKWLSMKRAEPALSKYDLKMNGRSKHRDVRHYLRALIFTRSTLQTYERTLKKFIDHARANGDVPQLRDIKPRHFREWIKDGAEKGLAKKTLDLWRSAASKLGTLIGKSESFERMSAKCGAIIRQAVKAGKSPGPSRSTPTEEQVQFAIDRLTSLDRAQEARTGTPRGYALAARLQMETGSRMISVTKRLTAASLRPDNIVAIIGKGGREQENQISPSLHSELRSHFGRNSGPLASYGGYRSAYRRAMEQIQGGNLGTHGLRRLSIQQYREDRFRHHIADGKSWDDAARKADGDALERLGHSRNREDHRKIYLAS